MSCMCCVLYWKSVIVHHSSQFTHLMYAIGLLPIYAYIAYSAYNTLHTLWLRGFSSHLLSRWRLLWNIFTSPVLASWNSLRIIVTIIGPFCLMTTHRNRNIDNIRESTTFTITVTLTADVIMPQPSRCYATMQALRSSTSSSWHVMAITMVM